MTFRSVPLPPPARLPLLLPLLAILAFVPGCGDDDDDLPTEARVIEVPFGVGTLEEAVAMATPNDTIRISESLLPPLETTLVVREEQTPLHITGFKTRPVLIAPQGLPALRFVRPREGTEVRFLSFSGGDEAALHLDGGERVLVEDCVFQGGEIHVLAEGRTLEVTVSRCLMVDPGLFGIDARGDASVRAERNTISGAGDCGIRLHGGTGEVVANVIDDSANYGIACTLDGELLEGSGCNDVFRSGTAHYLACDEPEDDFHLDPEFCDPAFGDYELDVLSPCAPENSGDCGQVGAFGVGCTPEDDL